MASLIFARTITRPVSRLTDAMAEIAADRLDIAVPGLERADELGYMAEAVEVFRSNGLKMADLRAAEQDMSEERATQVTVIQGLQEDISVVVGAAIDGDFSKRVVVDQPDPELRQLAENVNALVSTVQSGLDETGTVLAALARADLSMRMTGDYKGAFGQLKADTNAVAEQLGEIVVQLASRHVGLDRDAFGETDRPGVETFFHTHDADAAFAVSRHHGTVDRRRAAPARQQRAMQIETAMRRRVENRFG
jgi:methyl-accepting chemotaxis protein